MRRSINLVIEAKGAKGENHDTAKYSLKLVNFKKSNILQNMNKAEEKKKTAK